MKEVKATYINPFYQKHTLVGKGGTEEAWKKWIEKSFGKKNIIKITFSKKYE